MPTSYLGFLLKPQGFFDQNPSNDVPPEPAQRSCCNEQQIVSLSPL